MARVTDVILQDALAIAELQAEAMSSFAGTTVLISGAGGFLCSFALDVFAALNRVLKSPCRVIALDNFRTGLPERIRHLREDTNFEFVTHDVTTRYQPSRAVNYIVHGASIASPTFYRRFPLETIDANVNGTRRMLDLAREHEVRGFLQLSSSEIYGDPAPSAVPTSETYLGNVSCAGPRACYDESKRLGETLCHTYFQLFKIPVKIVRPFNVYGPGQRLDDARIIPDMLSAVLNERAIVLFSDGRATRAFCYVSDFVTAMLLLLCSDAAGEAYNVGNDEEITIADAAKTVTSLASSSNVFIEYSASQDENYLKDNPQRRCPNLQKIEAAIGWRPKITLREGLERTLRSYREERSSDGVSSPQ